MNCFFNNYFKLWLRLYNLEVELGGQGFAWGVIMYG